MTGRNYRKANWRAILLLSMLCGVFVNTSTAQTATVVVVADAMTHQPVAHVSLYAKESGHFRSCISDEKGHARVNFSFSRLTVSHLNYERQVLRRLPADTIFLRPRYQDVGEVVITNKEPEWIRRCLKQTVKQKEKHYFSHDGCEAFDYQTQSLSTNSFYRFHLTGLLRSKSEQHHQYAIVADTATIVAADSTKLSDTTNLRRMLYEDFMEELDGGFIRSHRFFHHDNYHGRNEHEVLLHFRSKKQTDDQGWLVMDTVRYTVVNAYRFSGLKTNRQERIDNMMYAMARVFGYRIDAWTRDYRVTYAYRPDSTLYPAEVRYKMYFESRDGDTDRSQEEFKQNTGGGFPNMEATLTLAPSKEESPDREGWLSLPPSWYIRFNTDADRQREMELSNLPATFTLYEEE